MTGEVDGAAAERTALAWQRTGLSVLLGCFVVLVSSFRTQIIAIGVAAGMLGLLMAALAFSTSPVNAHRSGLQVHSWPLLTIAAVSVAALGILGAAAAAVSLLR